MSYLQNVDCDETTVSEEVRHPLAPDNASTSCWSPVNDGAGSPKDENITENETSYSIQIQEDEHRTRIEGKTECDRSDEPTKDEVDSLSPRYSHISRGQRVVEAKVAATTGYPGRDTQGSTSFRNGRHRKALKMDTRVTSRTPIRCTFNPRLARGRHQAVIPPYPIHPGWHHSDGSDDATQHLGSRFCTQAESRNPTKLTKPLPRKVYEMSPAFQESHGCKECRLVVDGEANFRDNFRPDTSTECRPKYYSNHVHDIKNTCESRVAHRENRNLFGRGKVNDPQVIHRRDNRKPSMKHKREAKVFPMVHSQPQRDLTHKEKGEHFTVLQRQQHKELLAVHTQENEDLPMAENQENDALSLANTQENKDPSVVSRGESKDHPDSFECHECGSRYKNKASLQKHLIQFSKNSDERIFKCYFCSHSFASQKSRNKHERIHGEANFRDNFRPDTPTECRPKYYSNHVHDIKNTCESRVAHRENRNLFGRGKVNDLQVMHRRDNRKPAMKQKREAKIFPMVHSQPQRDLTHKEKGENLTVLQRQQHKDLLAVHTQENEDLPMAESQENDDLSLANTQENKDPSVGENKDPSVGENKDHPDSLECHECGSRYKSKATLQKHLIQFSKNSDERIFKCYFCSHSFASRKSRNKHERIHGKSRSLPCCCCDRAFSNRDSIQRHRRRRNIKMPPECVDCGWVFADKDYLNDHLLKVKSNLPFQCSVCGHNYPSELALVRHVKFHRRKREFECASCTARFVSSVFLKRHIAKSRRRTSLETNNWKTPSQMC